MLVVYNSFNINYCNYCFLKVKILWKPKLANSSLWQKMSHLWQQRPFRLVPQIFAYNGVKPDILGPPFNQSTGCCLVKDSGLWGQSKVTADWFCLMSSRTLWEEFSSSMHTHGRATMSVFITACQASSSHHCFFTLPRPATTTPLHILL